MIRIPLLFSMLGIAFLVRPLAAQGAADTLRYDLLTAAGIEGKHSDYHGFDCCDFTFEGRAAKIVRPRTAAAGHPWLWRMRFWGHEPQTEIALLERGFHLVFCDPEELFGNAENIAIWDSLYRRVVAGGLAPKAAYIGFSRGGLYAYLWALQYPERVSCIYADAPALDFKSWPGGKGRSGGNPELWELFKREFGFCSEEKALAWQGNPLDRAEEIAKAGYPILHICGDADLTVPIEENTDPFEKKIIAAGGKITVIRKPGVGHHPHSLADPAPIVKFILDATRQN